MSTTVISPVILHAPNELAVYEFGNEFGSVGYILAEHFCDAWQEMLAYEADHGNICDHGGYVPPDDGIDAYEHISAECDCHLTDDGRWVWDVYLWLKPLEMTVDHFYLAFSGEL